MKKIALTQGKFALVDNEDFEWLNRYKWHYHQGYATHGINVDGKVHLILLHRLIMLAPNDILEIDHIDGDGLNCQKFNLRFATDKGNGRNRGLASHNTSGAKGVHWHKGKQKWEASIGFNKKRIFLGNFKTVKEGSLAYNQAAQKYFGEFARLNTI